MVKKLNIFLIACIGVIVGFILFFSREIFFFQYQPEYFENYYYNSQWNVPQSTRGISDGELYKFVGYQLVKGENPFNINYEVPPFGKYLYGLAEYTVGNPYWVCLGFFFLTGLTIYLLSQELFSNKTTALFGLLLFVTTPFLASQIRETMLDLPLTSLFLFNVLFLVRFFKKHQLLDLIFAGGFLGLATGTKIGVYTPLILLIGLILVLMSSKKITFTLMYLLSTFGGYVVSFFCYFIKHPNPIPWLRLHEKPLNFYLGSGTSNVDYLNQWRGIFLNSYKGFWEGAAGTQLGDWSIILPLGVILSLIILVKGIKKREYTWIYLSLFTFVILLVNTLLPFWSRYLMPAVPVFILFTLFAFRKQTYLLLLIALLNLLVLIPVFTTNNLSGHSEAVSRFLNTRAYREMYRSINKDSRISIPEADFQSTLENFYITLKVKKIMVSITDVVSTKDTHKAKLNTKYQTDYGIMSNSQDIYFVLENNQWKTIWSWDYLWPNYDPKGKIEISEKIMSHHKSVQAVYVIPRLMYDWGKYTTALSSITNTRDSLIDIKLRETIPDDFFRFVGYVDPKIDNDTVQRNLLSGISIKNEILYDSATVVFIDSKNEKTSVLIKQE